jgi:FixJ family two-component response regulator
MREFEQRIVVVDDDPGMNQAVGRLLKAAGFRAITFGTAEELLEAGAARTAACLLLDIHLPGLSGFELYDRVRRGGSESPVIFMTAYDEPSSQVRANVAGAAGYFTKPFSGHALLDAIRLATRPGFTRVTQPFGNNQSCHRTN